MTSYIEVTWNKVGGVISILMCGCGLPGSSATPSSGSREETDFGENPGILELPRREELAELL